MTKSELLKTAKPILFNTEMVKAILEGKKTVTRRAIKPQPRENLTYPLGWSYATHKKGKFGWGKHECGGVIDTAKPRYYKNDILYVRETFRWVSVGEEDYYGECLWDDEIVQYKASNLDEFHKKHKDKIIEYLPWKPSIHMPKTAARIFLKVTDVRAERLQDMCVADCVREGADVGNAWTVNARPNFIKLWNSTIKKQDLDEYSWEANPWVWVYEFERIEK